MMFYDQVSDQTSYCLLQQSKRLISLGTIQILGFALDSETGSHSEPDTQTHMYTHHTCVRLSLFQPQMS